MRVPLVVPLALLTFALLAPSASSQSPPPTGEALYRSACATCHGRDGKGASVDPLALPTPPPDFSDCTFAPREPDGDWASIIRDGGPTRAFHRIMPAFGDALSDDEIVRVLGHVRTFCAEPSWPRGELNLPRSLVTEKAFPEDETVFTADVTAEGTGSFGTAVIYEKRFGARNQVELKLPVAAHETSTSAWRGGVGDVAVAFKRVLFSSLRTGTIVSATGEAVLPTGAASSGFGKGVTVFEPFMTAGQLLPRNSFVQVQAGFELPTDTDKAGREAFWRVSLGTTLTQGRSGRAWYPMIEVLAARELADGEETQWDVVPQVQVTLSTRQHIRANVGVRIPATDGATRSTRVLMYLLWDWFDGGFFDGW